jgi:protein arginine kinase activator
MLCEKCHKNPATVFMTQIVNGQKTELRLCPECSFKSEIPISFENIFQGFLNSLQSMAQASNRPETLPSIPCSVCSMTYEQFKSCGKLGCAHCYQVFANEMSALLKNVQGSIRHEGKFPRRSGVELRQKREVEQLRAHLAKAIEEENYEEAARLRDYIKELNAQGATP